jgi:hypothetical protein
MNTPDPQRKPDGSTQKRIIISNTTDSVAMIAGESDPQGLSLELASVAAAVYHYTVGIYRSAEIAGRVKIDPAFAAWRRQGTPTAEDIARARATHGKILRRCLFESLSWAWNVPLRSQVTGQNTLDYTEKVVSGRKTEFRSQADVNAEVEQRIAAAEAADQAEAQNP